MWFSIAERICLKDAHNGTQLKFNTHEQVERNVLSLGARVMVLYFVYTLRETNS